MVYYVLNRDFEPVYVVDHANSDLWHKKYNDIGEAEIYINCSLELLTALKAGYYLIKAGDNMVCEIIKRKIKTSIDDGDFLTIKAKDIGYMLGDRVLYEEFNYNGTFGNCVKSLINACYSGLLRQANIELDESNINEFNDLVSLQKKQGANLLTIIKDLFTAYEYGFRLTLKEGKLIFKMYKGVDHSTEEADIYVEFSNNYANMVSSEYDEDYEAVKNVAYIVGAYNEALGLTPKETVNSYIGLNRKELYVDATNLSWTYKVEGSEVEYTYTEDEYRAIMRELGKQALVNTLPVKNLTGEVDTVETYVYKTDYDLGDVIRVVNDYGISSQARIQEILESDDESEGYNVELTFNYKGVED